MVKSLSCRASFVRTEQHSWEQNTFSRARVLLAPALFPAVTKAPAKVPLLYSTLGKKKKQKNPDFQK